MKVQTFSLGAAIFFLAPQAQALCIHNGALSAQTTLEQEFRESSLIVRGTPTASVETPTNSAGDSGVSYTVKVAHTFKGVPPPNLEFFSERNSGGFYLDVGKEYLLFLTPLADNDPSRVFVPTAFNVNYNCGQSKPWEQVTRSDQIRLRQLSSVK